MKKILMAAACIILMLPATWAQSGKLPNEVSGMKNNEDKNAYRALIYTLGGWENLSKESRAMLRYMAHRMGEVRNDAEVAKKQVEASRRSPQAKNSSSELDQHIVAGIGCTRQYLQQPLSQISDEYLRSLKQSYAMLHSNPAQEIIAEINRTQRFLAVRSKIIDAKNNPYSASRVKEVFKQAEPVYDSLNAVQQKDFNHEFLQLKFYPQAIELVKKLIKMVNNDEEMKYYRSVGDPVNQPSALIVFNRCLQEVDRCAVGSDRKGDNIRRYISGLPWLYQRLEAYRADMNKDAIHNSSVEAEILNI